MSHVTDGDLHAWLDGALEELGEAEAVRVRHHLAECEACRRRLEEERSMREAADAILSGAAPDVRLPTLEELRSVALARQSQLRSGRRLQRLGWAASIMVALGMGWMLRGEWPGVGVRPGASELMVNESPTDAPESAARSETPASAGASERRTPSNAATVQDRVRQAGGASTQNAASAGTRDGDATVSLEKRKVETAVQRPATPVGEPGSAEAGQLAADKKVAQEATAGSTVPASPPKRDMQAKAMKIPTSTLAENVTLLDTTAKRSLPSLPRTDSVAGRLRPEFARMRDTTADAVREAAERSADVAGVAAQPAAEKVGLEGAAVTRPQAEAEEESSRSLAVPGLVVLSVTAMDATGAQGGVRVLQLLSTGDTLELIHLPPSRPPRLADEPAEGLTELTIPQPDGWLIARARLPRDSLQALVDRLRR